MEERERNRRNYIEGNTVRRQSAEPVRKPERERIERSSEEIRRERRRRQAAKHNQQRALQMDLRYVIFLIAATVVCCAVCIVFLQLKSSITTHMSNIAAIESQISEQKADNVAAKKRLETAMNLEEVKAAAAGLGMILPGSEQIRYYSVENSDYMNQYGEIPSN